MKKILFFSLIITLSGCTSFCSNNTDCKTSTKKTQRILDGIYSCARKNKTFVCNNSDILDKIRNTCLKYSEKILPTSIFNKFGFEKISEDYENVYIHCLEKQQYHNFYNKKMECKCGDIL